MVRRMVRKMKHDYKKGDRVVVTSAEIYVSEYTRRRMEELIGIEGEVVKTFYWALYGEPHQRIEVRLDTGAVLWLSPKQVEPAAEKQPEFKKGNRVVVIKGDPGLPLNVAGSEGIIISTVGWPKARKPEARFEVCLDNGKVFWFSSDQLEFATTKKPKFKFGEKVIPMEGNGGRSGDYIGHTGFVRAIDSTHRHYLVEFEGSHFWWYIEKNLKRPFDWDKVEPEPTEKPPVTSAAGIARLAADLVGGDREHEHGAKEDNFQRIATMWNAWLDIRKSPDEPLNAHDVGVMMTILKLARTQSGSYNPDDYTDTCGYAACTGEVAHILNTNGDKNG